MRLPRYARNDGVLLINQRFHNIDYICPIEFGYLACVPLFEVIWCNLLDSESVGSTCSLLFIYWKYSTFEHHYFSGGLPQAAARRARA